MFKQFPLFLLLGLLVPSALLLAQEPAEVFDGPYVFRQQDSLQVRWIAAGVAYDTTFTASEAFVFKHDSLPTVDLSQMDLPPAPKTEYEDNGKVVALSDVHGQFGIMKKLLQAHKIIDQRGNWSYADGQLVVVGDNMDRGDKVTEILWFLFFLEKQAAAAGGQVHVLLGNHEAMVLTGDLRYLHRKYRLVSAFYQEPYQEFFRPGSVLGDWLRQQNVVLKIGETLFVHGGVSPELQKLGLSPTQINKAFRQKIFSGKAIEAADAQRLEFLQGNLGPLWYRGYFADPALPRKDFEKTLKRWKADRLIIGHTSQPHIESRYEGKLLVIDCSIKLGKSGQLLKLLPGGIQIGEIDGSVLDFTQKEPTGLPKRAIFEYLYEAEAPMIRIATNTKSLIKEKNSEAYQTASFEFTDGATKAVFYNLEGRVRARGNIRKQVCYFPPLKLDLKKKHLDSMGYLKLDKLKIVLPCRTGKRSQQLLFKERLVYDLYEAIDTNHIQTCLVDFVITDGQKDFFSGKALLVEDEENFRLRKSARMVEKGGVALSILERDSWTKMRFFQYMIGNTDWSIFNRHNVEIVKMPNENIFAIPYDFDYCGLVGQGYAVPHESLPIKSVQERYFKRGPITEQEFDLTLAYYLSIEDKLMAICAAADYMDEKSRKECQRFIEDFYRVLRRPREMRYQALNFKRE